MTPSLSWQAFASNEKADNHRVSLKLAYVDMTGDLVTGLLLSQIVYWHLPDSRQKTRLRVEKDGHLWLVKARHEWWEECRLTPRQVDRALRNLQKLGLIVTRRFRFNGAPTLHIRLDREAFLERWQATISTEQANPFSPNGEMEFDQSANSISTKGEIPFSPNVKFHVDESVKTITDTTTDTTAETTTTETGKTTASFSPAPGGAAAGAPAPDVQAGLSGSPSEPGAESPQRQPDVPASPAEDVPASEQGQAPALERGQAPVPDEAVTPPGSLSTAEPDREAAQGASSAGAAGSAVAISGIDLTQSVPAILAALAGQPAETWRAVLFAEKHQRPTRHSPRKTLLRAIEAGFDTRPKVRPEDAELARVVAVRAFSWPVNKPLTESDTKKRAFKAVKEIRACLDDDMPTPQELDRAYRRVTAQGGIAPRDGTAIVAMINKHRIAYRRFNHADAQGVDRSAGGGHPGPHPGGAGASAPGGTAPGGNGRSSPAGGDGIDPEIQRLLDDFYQSKPRIISTRVSRVR